MGNFVVILILATALAGSFLLGGKMGYDDGISADVTNKYGDKWDCAYSDYTGFLMCYRTPKYKD